MDIILVKTKEEAIQWIHDLNRFGMKPGLERMEYMLDRLNHPERHLKFVHVAGTNGKGSTISYMAEVLKRSGYQVGTFTSPYLIDFTNRIQVNGEDITDDALISGVNEIIPLAKELEKTEHGAPTEFEVVTVLAILYFAKTAFPDIVLWEVGLGGRLDSTNVVYPILSVITSIGFDHMDVLGNTLEEITLEKAGIIKSGIPVVSGVEQEEAIGVLKDVVKGKRARIYQLNEQFSAQIHEMKDSGSDFSFEGPFLSMPNIELKMVGQHQVRNAAVALMALEILRQYALFFIEEDSIYSGLKYTRWPGRIEQVLSTPRVILDGAHNPEGAKSLADALSLYRYDKLILVTGILKDKAIGDFLGTIVPLTNKLIITEPNNPRRAKVDEIGEWIEKVDKNASYQTIADWKEAVNSALTMANQNDLVVITGSLYLIADVRRYLIDAKKS